MTGAISAKWAKGTGGPAGDEDYNLTPVVHFRKTRNAQSVDDDEQWVEDDAANTITPFDSSEVRARDVLAYSVYPEGGQGADLRARETAIAPPISATDGERQTDRGLRLADGMAVRRLTPLECERLMGWPDGWTEPAGSDSARYRACGNGVAAPVTHWIGLNIKELEA